MNLIDAFLASAKLNSQKVALYWGDDEYDYAYLEKSVRIAAFRLRQDYGVKPGDRVAILLKNCPEFITFLYGTLFLGAVVVPINNFLKPPEIGFMLADADIRILITEQNFLQTAELLKAGKNDLKVLYIDQNYEQSHCESCAPYPCAEPDLSCIIYTSGTTGKPKGAMLTHGNLLHNVESCRQVLATVNFDRFVLVLPMFHSFMLCVCICLPLTVGCSIILVKSLTTPKTIIHEIIALKGSILPGMPQLFRAFTDPLVPADLPLRLCISGAAPLPVAILRNFHKKFPFPLVEGYGLSEASPVVSINPINGVSKEGSIGLPIPNVEIRICGDDGTWLPTGSIGEICVRGGNVMAGYWKQPEATDQALKDGWLRTGDVGYMDEEGYTFITDRKKDMLLVNGNNVYPREIEEVYYAYPGIKEAAVIGIPDPRKGEQPLAYVSMVDDQVLDEKELNHFLRERIADYKLPRKTVVLPTLPRNATGKVLKTVLREMAATLSTQIQA